MAEAENTRLEAFSDGVFAIALTLLIIEIRIPDMAHMTTNAELWTELVHLVPLVSAFVLSFIVIFITWVNHRGALRLVNASTPSFIYANGLLLLSVVCIPFPTALLGESILTDHASPAVVLYNGVLVVQAIGWLCVTRAALGGGLTSNEHSAATMLDNHRRGYFAIALYSSLAVAAVWLPRPAATATAISWLAWLVISIRMKHS
jgi:uncharacterized membrane protein